MDILKWYLLFFLLIMFIIINVDVKYSVLVLNGLLIIGFVFYFFGKIIVEIINDFGNILVLKYYCKLKEDDFGKWSL